MHELALTALASGKGGGRLLIVVGLLVVIVVLAAGWIGCAAGARAGREKKP